MKPDLYTKAVLTVVALMLTVIVCKPLFSPDTTASAQGAFAGVQMNGNEFFDTRNGDLWAFYSNGSVRRWEYEGRMTKLGQPLTNLK